MSVGKTALVDQVENCNLMDIKVVDNVSFTLNGRQHNVSTSNISSDTTLNEYLREHLNLTGTKYMCRIGGCGACVVSVNIRNPATSVKQTYAVNSCLVNVLSCQNWEITTVEGIGNRVDGLHEVQQQIVDFNASQCGFCTPGMVMSMYALREGGGLTPEGVEHAMGGNICRCTGYRSLLDAYKTLANEDDIEDLSLCGNKCKDKCDRQAICPQVKYDDEIQVFQTLGTQKWYRATKIADVFRVFRQNRNTRRSYTFVAGNTGKGIYEEIMNVDYCIDISSVADLHGYTLDTNKLVIGANTTITEAIEAFYSVAERDDGFKHLQKCAEHLKQVASVPINNLGTLAGNLALKHAYNEFPSDIFLLLEAIGAHIVIDNGLRSNKFTPVQFLSYNMQQKLIRRIELPPLPSSIKFDSFKISKHTQTSVAIVNAVFLCGFNNKNVVNNATVLYGGINPAFTHASKLESFLQGKNLFDNANLQRAYKILEAELQPEEVTPPIGEDFRKQLAISLFYKFVLSIAPDGVVQQVNKSGGERLIRPLSSGTTKFKVNTDMPPIGKPLGKMDVADLASGTVKFVSDMADLPGQLHAAFVLADAAPGSVLKKIDASKALAIDGVVAFFQASDIEGINSFMGPVNNVAFNQDEEVFVALDSPVMFHSQSLGLIVAKSRKLAEAACDLVEVMYDDATSVPLMNIQDVLKLKATDRIHHEQEVVALRQDPDADVVIKATQTFGWQYHHFMELTVSSIVPTEDDGLIIHPSTQWPDGVQAATARCLNIKTNQITVKQHRIGGGFGGKITRALTSVAGALAAHKLRRPVKVFIPLQTQMKILGKRSATLSQYEVGVDGAGVIKYLNNSCYVDMGAYGNALYSSYMLDVYLNSYVNTAFQTDTYWVRTDHPAAISMRAPGSLTGGAMIESIMEQIACKLGKDPLEVKKANLNSEKHKLLSQLIDECVEWSEYSSRRKEIDDFNKLNRWRKRGISIVPLTYGLYFEKPMHVQVTIYQADGAVEVVHGGMELGQGINTKITQATAYLLGVDIDMIRVKCGNSFITPNNMTTGGSITTDSACKALITACINLKTRIEAAAKEFLPTNATWLQKVQNAMEKGVNLTENSIFSEDPDNSANYFIYAVAVCEVELDLLTGGHIVQRVDILADSGDSLNPLIDVGQIEGAFVMGIGYWTMEEIITDAEDGALLTNDTWTYKVPAAKDIPVDFRVRLAEDVPNEKNTLRNKTMSQPPICLAVGVPLAIRHALQSARSEANPDAEPWALMDGPSTIDWIYTNSLNNYTQYIL